MHKTNTVASRSVAKLQKINFKVDELRIMEAEKKSAFIYSYDVEGKLIAIDKVTNPSVYLAPLCGYMKLVIIKDSLCKFIQTSFQPKAA